MCFYAFHGEDLRERELGQRYEVDLELELDMSAAVKTDALRDTVDYRAAYTITEDLVVRRQFQLIETLADRIARECLDRLPIFSATVRVRKMKPPVKGIIDYVEAHIRRQRQGGSV